MPRRQDPDQTYGEKLIKLFAHLLFTGRKRSLIELAKMLQCSKPTVRRLIDDISRSFDIPILEETRSRRLYFWIERPRQPRPLPVDPMELSVLEMCRAFTQHLLGKSQFDAAARGLQKTEALLPSGKAPDGAVFACFRPGSIDYTPHQETIETLAAAMDLRRVCRMTYKALGRDPKTYDVIPLKMFSHKDTVYLHVKHVRKSGRQAGGKEGVYRLLAVHRIQKVKLTSTIYDPDPSYDFDARFNQEFGIIKEKAFRVTVLFWGWAADFVSERIWSPDQELSEPAEGRVELSFTAGSSVEVIGWLLFFKDEAELLSPDWLRKEVAECVAGIHRIYQRGAAD